MNLESNHYGKRVVRLLRVSRGEQVHEIAEWEADALLEGDLAGSYLSDDNSSVVPTDTVKNTVLALAHDLETATRDEYALALARHFVGKYHHLSACDVEVREKQWTRMVIAGQPHEHSFTREANGQPFTKVRVERGGETTLKSGIRGFVILKTTQSGFSGFPRCDYTTLPETDDRILSTSLDAEWDYLGETTSLGGEVITAMLKVFAETFSPSVQRTLFLMGEAALEAFPALKSIKLTMPNKHYLSLDLTKIGRPAGQKKVFLPTDDPFGYIEAVISR